MFCKFDSWKKVCIFVYFWWIIRLGIVHSTGHFYFLFCEFHGLLKYLAIRIIKVCFLAFLLTRLQVSWKKEQCFVCHSIANALQRPVTRVSLNAYVLVWMRLFPSATTQLLTRVPIFKEETQFNTSIAWFLLYLPSYTVPFPPE